MNPVIFWEDYLATDYDDLLSGAINDLLNLGMFYIDNSESLWSQKQSNKRIEGHCHQLIIQMSALLKNISAEMLKFNQAELEPLKQAAGKYAELVDQAQI